MRFCMVQTAMRRTGGTISWLPAAVRQPPEIIDAREEGTERAR
jgi:hypothetical protein